MCGTVLIVQLALGLFDLFFIHDSPTYIYNLFFKYRVIVLPILMTWILNRYIADYPNRFATYFRYAFLVSLFASPFMLLISSDGSNANIGVTFFILMIMAWSLSTIFGAVALMRKYKSNRQ